MDVIANNIANVNTAGFKSSRVTFSDAFAQTLRGASAANMDVGRGGLNPMQIGLGANVAAISTVMTPGGAQRTDAPLDLMIEGDGFFVVGDDVSGLFFTRAGHFTQDGFGNVVAPNGMMLQGWRAEEVGGDLIINRAPVQGIRIGPDQQTIPANATTRINFAGNLDPRAPRVPTTMNFRDSLGNNWQIDVEFIATNEPGAWDVQMVATPGSNPATTPVRLQGGNQSVNISGPGLNIGRVHFDTSGNMIHIGPHGAPPTGTWPTTPRTTSTYMEIDYTVAGTLFHSMNIALGREDWGDPGNDFGAIRLDFGALVQREGRSNAVARDYDGREAGDLIGISVGPDGVITGTYSNGQERMLWQIAMARFENPAGLARMGNSLFAQTRNSGTPFDGIGLEAAAIGSQLLGGTLEMSNVDLSFEFTEMITTQRGFQANSRIITTSDEILQELVNLRR